VIITSGQPSLNPRMVKEADALTDAGYQVTVIYAYWNDWGTKFDAQLINAKKWKAISVGGDPYRNLSRYYLSKIIYKTATLGSKISKGRFLKSYAIARSSYFLKLAATTLKADLYIAHNLGALPAAVSAARLYHKPCGFDAEDFHRNEMNDDLLSVDAVLKTSIEDKYIPAVDYLTASSPLIAQQYQKLYPEKAITTILNVFPRLNLSVKPIESSSIRLFWFSQTIGNNRGIEGIITALGIIKQSVQLHLLGHSSNQYKSVLINLAIKNGLAENQLQFYEPIPADELLTFASQFDIGLASEPGFSLNNKLALSNKLFTYIQSGLALAVSNTIAQKKFLEQYPQTGKLYHSPQELADILSHYLINRYELVKAKKACFELGQSTLNWETEQTKFLNIVKPLFVE
jgi:hypothetical protein